MDCTQRITVAMSISSGQSGTEEVHAVMRSKDEHKLADPIQLSVHKSDAVVRYPVTYKQSVNAAPYEVIHHHGLGGCDDGNMAIAPSCGWVVDANAVPILDSQGFCCSCSFDQLLGTSSNSLRSSQLQCDLFGNAQSAHCLRMGELWYAIYELSAPQLDFEIIVTATQANGSLADYTLSMGPDRPGVSSSDEHVVARLLGDLAPYSGDMPDIGATKYLMVPSQPASHPRVLEGVEAWMLVDKSAVTLDGLTCNKIGVSYTAFRNQANKCNAVAGSCLANQLNDLHMADEARIARGELPLHRVSTIATFSPYVDAAGSQYVAFAIETPRNSLITLTMAADDIKFVVAESTGLIISCNVNDFVAQSSNGWMHVRVANTGLMTADYTVCVRCSAGILDGIEARPVSLAPDEERLVTFVLFALHKNGTTHSCMAELLNARQMVVSSMNVSFNTRSLDYDLGAQGGELMPTVGHSEVVDIPSDNALCETFCTVVYDVPCFITFGCGRKLITFALLVGLAIGICCCCCCIYRSGICSFMIFDALPSCYDSRRSRQRHRKQPNLHGHGHVHVYGHAQRGRTRGSDIQTHHIVGGSTGSCSTLSRTAYLNLQGVHAAAVLKQARYSRLLYCGEAFSLRGEIPLTGSTRGVFRLSESDEFQHWRWSLNHRRFERLPIPYRMNPSFFSVKLTGGHGPGADLQAASVITDDPAFMCINVLSSEIIGEAFSARMMPSTIPQEAGSIFGYRSGASEVAEGQNSCHATTAQQVVMPATESLTEA